jgi:hypothetical protein
MARATQKEGDGEHCEMKVGQRMIEQQQDLSRALITADALHCQKKTARAILTRGGDFLIQVKDNQKTTHKLAAECTAALPPLLPAQARRMDGSTST